MKNIGLLMSLVLILSSCKQEPKHDGYTVTGNIKGFGDGMAKMMVYDQVNRKPIVIDSAMVADGKFEFKGNIEHPDMVSITLNNQSLSLLLDNTAVTIDGDAALPRDQYEPIKTIITGSDHQKLYEEQQSVEKEISNDPKYAQMQAVNKAYSEAGQARNTELQKKLYDSLATFDHLREEFAKRNFKSKWDFVKNNAASAAAPNVIWFSFSERYMNLEDMDELMDMFQGDATQTQAYAYIKDEYDAINRTRPGAKAPDFTLKTPEGEDLSLSDIKDKYILIDFWASWCKPCRASYPHLKKVYSKYKDKGFEVLAVSTDSDHDKWKQAIKEDNTTWMHVVDTFSRPMFPSDIGTLYGVPFLPTTYLLDKNGVVLAKNLHADELDAKMEELFGY